MSEGFLDRWSRRKRDVAQQEKKQEAPAAAEDVARDQARAQTPHESTAAPAADQPAFDLSQLPSMESITAETDISGFLAPGVPSSLRHAALRRVWSADPSIRDFVGLSENSWDFTAPDGVPGFGPIGSSEEVRRLLAQVIGGPEPTAERSGGESAPEASQDAGPATESAAPEQDAVAAPSRALPDGQQEQPASEQTSVTADQELLQSNKDYAAMQEEEANQEYTPASGRGPHGRALPK